MTRDRRDPPGDGELVALLPPELERQLSEALRAAWAPESLDPAKNESLMALALEDPLAQPSSEEVAESERLRRALEGDGEHPYAELARALAAAGSPAALEPAAAEQAVKRVAGDPERSPQSGAAARRGNLVYVVFGAAAATLALAASVALVVGPMRDRWDPELTATMQELAVSRSTASMFHEKFETAETTERVDRIAVARARELRSNRYALWGVR
jgi:hypothetical protein